MSEGPNSGRRIGARAVVEPLPRGVQTEHVRFVAANRHRMSWQTMAAILRVNVNDLRRHCDKAFAAAQPEPAAPPATKPAYREPCDRALVLDAARRGAVSYEDFSDACEISRTDAARMVAHLRHEGLIAASGLGGGWQLTTAGAKALRKAGVR